MDLHQKEDEDGRSIVRGVILEHNMTAASLLYTNISFETLGTLLGIDGDKVKSFKLLPVCVTSGRRNRGTNDLN